MLRIQIIAPSFREEEKKQKKYSTNQHFVKPIPILNNPDIFRMIDLRLQGQSFKNYH